MSKYDELKRLALAATPGERLVGFYEGVEAGDFIGAYEVEIAPCAGYFATVTCIHDNASADADFIAAANPAAVLALIAEIEDFKQGAKAEADAGDEARQEVRQLKAENEALRKDLVDWQGVVAAVRREVPERFTSHARGNAPGHGHSISGVWDNDSGALAGKECAWCKAWNAAMSKAAQ